MRLPARLSLLPANSLARLRGPALGLLAAVTLGSALLVWSQTVHDQRRQVLLEAQSAASQAAHAARLAPERLSLVQDNAARFSHIEAKGFLGAEARTGWITALGKTQAALGLESLSWRLAPQQASPLAPGLRVSAMDLSASPVDAQRLAALLEQLKAAAPGWFTVERCALNLNQDGHAGLAECRLSWWTWEDVPPQP